MLNFPPSFWEGAFWGSLQECGLSFLSPSLHSLLPRLGVQLTPLPFLRSWKLTARLNLVLTNRLEKTTNSEQLGFIRFFCGWSVIWSTNPKCTQNIQPFFFKNTQLASTTELQPRGTPITSHWRRLWALRLPARPKRPSDATSVMLVTSHNESVWMRNENPAASSRV